MNEDLKEKYGKMTEEEFAALPEEEKAKVTAALEFEGKVMAEQFKEAIDSLTDEEKAAMREGIKKSQEIAQKTANYTEEEIMASMMNPETEGYDEEDLRAAREMMKNQENEKNQAPLVIKKGFIYSLKKFFKGLFR